MAQCDYLIYKNKNLHFPLAEKHWYHLIYDQNVLIYHLNKKIIKKKK